MSQDQQALVPTGILLYQTEDGQTRIEVRVEDETVWLTQKWMAELFQKDAAGVKKDVALLQGFMSFLGVPEK